MPLLDHFHAPMLRHHSWECFHGRWAYAMADDLNRRLPPQRYLAEATTHSSTRMETDVAEFELRSDEHASNGNGAAGETAVAVETWAPPVAAQTVAISFPDEFEVQVYDLKRDRKLVGAIELVSPGNKDTEDRRSGFAAKCATYLQRGIGLIVVDVVTDTSGNLHRELLDLLGQGDAFEMPSESDLYVVAYHPKRRDAANLLDLWPVELALGGPLPLLPLALRGAFFVPVDLEATYTEARDRCRL